MWQLSTLVTKSKNSANLTTIKDTNELQSKLAVTLSQYKMDNSKVLISLYDQNTKQYTTIDLLSAIGSVKYTTMTTLAEYITAIAHHKFPGKKDGEFTVATYHEPIGQKPVTFTAVNHLLEKTNDPYASTLLIGGHLEHTKNQIVTINGLVVPVEERTNRHGKSVITASIAELVPAAFTHNLIGSLNFEDVGDVQYHYMRPTDVSVNEETAKVTMSVNTLQTGGLIFLVFNGKLLLVDERNDLMRRGQSIIFDTTTVDFADHWLSVRELIKLRTTVRHYNNDHTFVPADFRKEKHLTELLTNNSSFIIQVNVEPGTYIDHNTNYLYETYPYRYTTNCKAGGLVLDERSSMLPYQIFVNNYDEECIIISPTASNKYLYTTRDIAKDDIVDETVNLGLASRSVNPKLRHLTIYKI